MGKYVLAQYNYTNPPQGFGVVDLGTLSWYRQFPDQPNESMITTISDIKTVAYWIVPKMVCPKYKTVTINDVDWHVIPKSIAIANQVTTLKIYDPDFIGKTAEEFQTAMSGVKLLYELNSNTIPYTSVPCSYYALHYNSNLWDEQWRLGYFDNGNFIGTVPSIQRLCSKNPIKVTPGSTIKSNVSNSDAYFIYQYDANMNFIGETHFSDKQAELSSTCSYINFSSLSNKTGYKVHTVIYTGTKSEDAINTNQYLLEVLIK